MKLIYLMFNVNKNSFKTCVDLHKGAEYHQTDLPFSLLYIDKFKHKDSSA